jgi:hypothetical protein
MELVGAEGWFFKPAALEWISLSTKCHGSAVAVQAQKRCTTAEDDGVLSFANLKLP